MITIATGWFARRRRGRRYRQRTAAAPPSSIHPAGSFAQAPMDGPHLFVTGTGDGVI